jgi:hypothetical protein
MWISCGTKIDADGRDRKPGKGVKGTDRFPEFFLAKAHFILSDTKTQTYTAKTAKNPLSAAAVAAATRPRGGHAGLTARGSGAAPGD